MQKVQSFISLLVLAFLLAAQHPRSARSQTFSANTGSASILASETQEDSIDTVVRSIIDISAHDFYDHQQPLPSAFRNVQLNTTVKPNKEVLYILCGEFTTPDKEKTGEWTHFTTIKNSEYEQWIGSNGLVYCENSKEIHYKKADLSSELLLRLHSIQKLKK
ncbi:MAG: hypothetical protein Q8896_09730 [Bacteroidota bacterium]|nr:hypothetical protein [Bacteroidota bacterium]